MENFNYKRSQVDFPATVPKIYKKTPNRLIQKINRKLLVKQFTSTRMNPTKFPKLDRFYNKVVQFSPEIADIFCKVVSRSGSILWSHLGANVNKMMHALEGNKKIGYNIAAWNCRRGLLKPDGSASSKVTDIEIYLQKHQLHMLAVIESDLHGPGSRIKRSNPLSTNDIENNLRIDGYSIKLPQSWYAHDQARILVYIKEGIKVKERKLNSTDSDLPSLSFELGLGKEKKTCVNFHYREFTGGISGLADIGSQSERLLRQIGHWKTLFATGRDVVILGDSNLCAMQWDSDSYQHKQLASMVQDFLLEEASQQLVTDITRSELVRNVIQTSCIDHCYSDVREKITGPYVEAVGDSDHLGVRVLKYCRVPVVRPQAIRKRCYKQFSVADFLTDVFHSNINASVSSHERIDGAAEAFRNEFLAILNYHAPVKTIQIRRKYCPYLSIETKALMNERNILQKEASDKCDPTLLDEFKKKAKEVKKSVTKDKKVGKSKNLSDQASSKEVWGYVRNILGSTKNLSPTAVKDGDGALVTNPSKVASIFNTYFLEKVRLLRMKTNAPPKVDPVTRLQLWLDKRETTPPPFNLQEISRTKLRKLIKKMKGGRASGVDNIDSYSLKLAAPLIEDALLHLINLSIRSGSFSSFWKHQLIFPNHKKSDKCLVENYRPVSHLIEVGKLVEYAVYDQVTDHFLSNDLFHRNHHGGLPHHSTATALIQMHDIFLEAAQKKQLTAALLLDQSAAYDLLDHPILLKKLAAYNFSKDSIKWFQSYLSERSQSVQVETKQSMPENLKDHAAPQGSILGGLLFLINENDFPSCRVNGESVLFVDDDTDCVSDSDLEKLQEKIQIEADNSCDWLTDNRMCVAGDKSKLVIVGTKELKRRKLGDNALKIVVDGKEVIETKSEKLLGVILNDKMTWQDHLYGEKWREKGKNSPGLIPQLSKRLGILKKLSASASKKKLRMLSFGLFYSKLAYCLPLFTNTWGLTMYKDKGTRFSCFTKEDNRKLQVLQNQVTRLLIAGAGYNRDQKKYSMSTEELLEKSGDLSVHQLGAFHTLTMTKKILKYQKPSYLAEKLTAAPDTGTRSGTILHQENASLGILKEGFISRASKLFNQLPLNIKSEDKIEKFKKLTKQWIKVMIPVKP